VTGYGHPQYALSFTEVGRPRELLHCQGWVIERSIPGTDARDAMGCYPVFECRTWQGLPADLLELEASLVSVSVVVTPFADVEEADLRRWFDVVVPFKSHYVTDLAVSGAGRVSGRHRRNVREALRHVRVAACVKPLERLGEWCSLYGHLVDRHAITGLRTFSRAAFERQLGVPGIVMFRASIDEETVGLHLWYESGQIAYAHLGATSVRGYEHMASYALYAHAIEYFRDRVRWLDLGGVAGLSDEGVPDGLRRFKAGWATGTRPTFVCGKVLQPPAYAHLAAERGVAGSSYFPAYRQAEFLPGTDRAEVSGF
jgi:hypothetical protein